jgi:simple sugar transport system ATP-binding protein
MSRGSTLRDERGATRLRDVALSLRAGEIVGIAGIAGNGQSELLEVLAGMRAPAAGSIRLCGEAVLARRSHDMRARGLLHVPEDRLRTGLVPPFAAFESAVLGFQHEDRYAGWRPARSAAR